jgi:large conductance mechanosensitive channel
VAFHFKAGSQTLRELRTFALKPNAFDLAVAVALGGSFTLVINAIVQGLFIPIIGAIFKTDFSKWTFTINGSVFSYGSVISAIITFGVVAVSLFFFVVKPLNAIRQRFHLDIDPDEATTAPCPACTTNINTGARRCPACTEEIGLDWAPEPQPAA